MNEFVEKNCSFYEPHEGISYGFSISISYVSTAFTLKLFPSSAEVNTTSTLNLVKYEKTISTNLKQVMYQESLKLYQIQIN